MKYKSLIVLAFLVFFSAGCQKDADDPVTDPLNGSWNLINVSGGFAGINENFPAGSIIWTFNATAATLSVVNNDTTNALFDGLPSGNYAYSIFEVDKDSFLMVDAVEWGGLSFLQDELIINQNAMSNGSGADRFVLKLTK
jgi:hypothetical protein